VALRRGQRVEPHGRGLVARHGGGLGAVEQHAEVVLRLGELRGRGAREPARGQRVAAREAEAPVPVRLAQRELRRGRGEARRGIGARRRAARRRGAERRGAERRGADARRAPAADGALLRREVAERAAVAAGEGRGLDNLKNRGRGLLGPELFAAGSEREREQRRG